MFVVIGARDFSPEITVHLIGTKVPCFDKVPPPQIPICRDEGGFFQNVAVSLLFTKSLRHTRGAKIGAPEKILDNWLKCVRIKL